MAEQNEAGKDVSSDMEIEEQNVVLQADEEGGIKVDDDIYIPPPLKTINDIGVTGARLMITKIVNENFKSYRGTQVIGPFHKVQKQGY